MNRERRKNPSAKSTGCCKKIKKILKEPSYFYSRQRKQLLVFTDRQDISFMNKIFKKDTGKRP